MDEAEIHFELVLVDDGSKDGSFEEIRRLSKSHSVIRGLRLSRNFGHQAAVLIGLQNSRGDYIGIIDDDMQDPPDILPDFFSRLYEQADVVYGIRRKRKENFIKKLLYASFYRILGMLSDIEIPLDAGDFCVMKRSVVDAMLQFQEANPFLRGIRAWVGFKQIGIEYQRDARIKGTSGYTVMKYFRLAIAGILSFSYIPLRLATLFGIFAASMGFIFAAYVVWLWINEAFEVPGYASLIVVITFLGGVQLITIGILGEYLARLSDNVRRRSVAVVAETTFKEPI
jgi:dolichol-phosphate mannosyltransferase